MMFQEQQLSQSSRLFIQNVHTVSPGNLNFISAAIARSLAWRLALPTMEGSVASISYIEMHDDTVRKALSTINEMLVIAIADVAAMTQQFWSMRYAVAYPDTYAIGTEGNAKAAILGYGNSLSKELAAVIDADSVKFLELVNGFTRVFIDLGVFAKPTE